MEQQDKIKLFLYNLAHIDENNEAFSRMLVDVFPLFFFKTVLI